MSAMEISKQLESLWIQREIDLRAKDAATVPGIPAKAYEVMRCRQELQRAFGLVMSREEMLNIIDKNQPLHADPQGLVQLEK